MKNVKLAKGNAVNANFLRAKKGKKKGKKAGVYSAMPS